MRRADLKSVPGSTCILQTAMLKQIFFRGFWSFEYFLDNLLPSKWGERPHCDLQGRSKKKLP